jgi:beta-aspartyl-peptidase (threonine type)
MRPLAIALFLFSLGKLACAAEPDVQPSSETIRAVLDAQVAAWNQGDIDRFMAAYALSPDPTFVSGDEVTRGWQTVHDRYAKKYCGRQEMGTLTFSDLTITPLCEDGALVLGSWRLQRQSDEPHGKFTLLFRKLPEGWRILYDHTSAASPPK